MRKFSPLFARYVLQSVLPYFIFTWLLLSVILFVQQASRYSDILLSAAISSSSLWQLAIALIPNVIAFTCPIAALVGVVIGLSRMKGDSEIVSIRSAGVGNVQIVIPIFFFGFFLSVFALFINLKGVPFAARIVRHFALEAALYKLESPIEPGIFNTEVNGFTIYVKSKRHKDSTWENVFIHQENKQSRRLRLITAKKGRIDSTGEDSEIVLNDAKVMTFKTDGESEVAKIASENLKDLRLTIQTERSNVIKRLTKIKETPEEMGLAELAQYAQKVEGRERTEAELLWYRRLLLSIAPLLFALLGSALVTKFNRGGKGFGVFLSLVSLIFYYLLALLGEQLARTNSINVFTASLIPLVSSVAAIVWFYSSQRFFIFQFPKLKNFLFKKPKPSIHGEKASLKNTYIDFTTGILDFDIVWSLLKNYLFALLFLTIIYVIFTAFELWKFVGTIDNGVSLLFGYLFFLAPFVYIELSPSALMIATLATYVIKSRQNEIVGWTSAGQSAYRLLFPCFILMIGIGFLNFGFQEWVLTETNRIQDSLRARIRSRNAVLDKNERYWVSSADKIYSFEKKGAFDNEITSVKKIKVFQFDPQNFRIKNFYYAKTAQWSHDAIVFTSQTTRFNYDNENRPVAAAFPVYKLNEPYNPFKQMIRKPSHLNINETERRIENTKSEMERRNYIISLQEKYSTPFLPFIIIIFTAPFALSLSRKRTVVALSYAVAIWLLFMGTTNIFKQVGLSGFISPYLAVWSPLFLFTVFGFYLMTRIKT